MKTLAGQTPDYSVDLPVFSGPLDLLLHLINRNELDITAISLVEVTDQYLQQIEKLKENKVSELADFLVIAARLLLIKSRALLPSVPALPGDEEEIDPAEELAEQLRQYRRFKQVAGFLGHRQSKGLRTYLRVAPGPILDRNLDLSGISLDVIAAAMRNAMARADQLDDSVEVATRVRTVTIEKQAALLRSMINSGARVFFDQLLSENVSWKEVSVTLLAVLEMIKQHEVNVYQPVLFGPIEIIAVETEETA